MASNYTQQYQLNQWSADDQVLRTEFNGDNARIEAALAAHEQKLSGLNEIGIEYGTYVGTGKAGPDYPNTLSFSQKPILIFVGAGISATATLLYSAPIAYVPGYSSGGAIQLTWGTNSVSWYSSTLDKNQQLNASNIAYSYFAILEMSE